VFPLSDCFDLSMRGRLDVAFLGGVQFDPRGGVNASVIGDYRRPKVRLPGGAGSAVYLPTAKRVILWRTRHDRRGFVEKTDFLTGRGNVDGVVTNMGVLKMADGELRLRYWYPGFTPSEIADNTGFPLDVSSAEEMRPPSADELRRLRVIDAKNSRYMELCGRSAARA
jgi:glutaconate CoA-transferase subunit B